MQAYDSVVIAADVELGGTDQLFNLLAGRELMEKLGMEPQVCLTLPLLEGTDGVQKMSKSYGNYIGLTDAPDDMFGKVMSIPDVLMPKYFRLATSLPVDEIDAIETALADGAAHPTEVKRRLAREIVALYHGPEAAEGGRGGVRPRLQAPRDARGHCRCIGWRSTRPAASYLPALMKDAGSDAECERRASAHRRRRSEGEGARRARR